MTLPEKVRDVTQSEWLEVRERLALVESHLALAMAWGAEVCARLDDETAVGWGVEHARCEAMERAERAEAERDAMRKERDEAQRGRTSVSAVNAALRDYPDADTSALWVPASEALEYQACWHRDVAKGRAAIEKRDADLAAARAQLSETVEALRLARNEILSGIDAEQLRITREIQEARREAERERDSLRAQLDSLLAKVTWMLTAPDFDRAAVERRVGLMPMTELHAIADAYIERVRAEERERCAVGAVVQMVRGE